MVGQTQIIVTAKAAQTPAPNGYISPFDRFNLPQPAQQTPIGQIDQLFRPNIA
jgi:hypothetical protein